MNAIKYYKVLGKGGTACTGGSGKWNLPVGKKKGKWMPKIEDIKPYVKGYHLCQAEDLIEWLNEEIYEAEGGGDFIRHENNKDVFSQARLLKKFNTWNEKNARLFAADCAEHVLPIFEKQYPKDDRPRVAIQAARDLANGKINAAASSAASSAAWAAARSAARSAALSAASSAAWAEAGDAAWATAWERSAASSAASSAAWAAARSAARSAVWAVAWAAVRDAARDAAWAEARAAAKAAAWAEAGDAENQWQIERLFFYLEE